MRPGRSPRPTGSSTGSHAMHGRSSRRSVRLARDGERDGKGRIPLRFRQPQRLSEPSGDPGYRAPDRVRGSNYVPVLLGGVFKLTNNRSPAESLAGIRNKPEYERLETARFVARHGITRFTANPFFPGEHPGPDARRGGGAEARRIRAICGRDLPAHVGGPEEAGRPGRAPSGARRVRSGFERIAAALWRRPPT